MTGALEHWLRTRWAPWRELDRFGRVQHYIPIEPAMYFLAPDGVYRNGECISQPLERELDGDAAGAALSGEFTKLLRRFDQGHAGNLHGLPASVGVEEGLTHRPGVYLGLDREEGWDRITLCRACKGDGRTEIGVCVRCLGSGIEPEL